MAVVRVELMPSEIDWIVAECEKARPKVAPGLTALRALKRSQAQVHESVRREREVSRRERAALPTAQGQACVGCGRARGQAHEPDCLYVGGLVGDG